jgi:signal-transduction protein with cAMP-binding, CBS, and nucleotidyltransferase domain
MQFTVRDWMIDLVVFVDADTLVTDALETMRRRYISSLIVSKSEQNPEFGILTSTDICDKVVAKSQNPGELKVRDVMTSPVISVQPEMSIIDCAKIMSDNYFHHLPVTDAAGNVVGMISATDFLVVAEAMGRNGERSLR